MLVTPIQWATPTAKVVEYNSHRGMCSSDWNLANVLGTGWNGFKFSLGRSADVRFVLCNQDNVASGGNSGNDAFVIGEIGRTYAELPVTGIPRLTFSTYSVQLTVHTFLEIT